MDMDRIIKVNPLRESSIKKAIADLEHYKKLLEEFPINYTNAMMQNLTEIMAEEAPNEAVRMLKNIYVNDYGDKAEGVVVFDGRVEFIEFGTGEIGLQLHDGINDEWLNALPPPYNNYWNTGSFIVHNKKSEWDLDYWWYKGNDGKYHKTSGIPANPFMWRSVERLIGMHKKIRNEVLKW